MSDLSIRATHLYNSLHEFKPTDSVGPPVGDVFDAVVEMAKKEFPDDPIIGRMRPSRRGQGSSRPLDTAGDLATVVDQILTALGEGGPSIA